MCFTLVDKEVGKNPKPKVAAKDITCWKRLSLDKTPIHQPHRRSYKNGKIYNAMKKTRKITKFVIVEGKNINEGIHSFRTKKECARICKEKDPSGADKPSKFQIPIGTPYYANKLQFISLRVKAVAI